MKAISIWQPHASLIISGQKSYETRSWPAWRSLIGHRIWIHAGKAQDDLLDLHEYLVERDAGLGTDPDSDAFVTALKASGFTYLRELPRGCLLGTAVLAASLPTDRLVSPGPFGDFSPGRYAWRMTDLIPLPKPIPYVGRQGFFEVPDDVALSATFAAQAAC